MINKAFGILVGTGLFGTGGVLMAFFPRVIPRMVNANWAFFGMKSRLAEEDYEKLGVRISGGLFIVFAIYILVVRWSDVWQ
jgi:hypothetical protein